MIKSISNLVSARHTGTPSTAGAVPLPDKGGVSLNAPAAHALPACHSTFPSMLLVIARHTGTPSTAGAVPLPDKGG